MNNLSKKAREHICDMIGIRDKESIFIKNADAFKDRIKVLREFSNSIKYIETYKEELKSFDSEEEYLKFLEEAKLSLYKDIEYRLRKADIISKLFGSSNDEHGTYKFKTILNENCMLHIYFDSPLFEGLRYACVGLMEIEDTLSEYVYNITKSKFLALMKDINIEELKGQYIKNVLKTYTIHVGLLLFSVVSPSYINKKELSFIGESEVYFVSSENKSVDTVNKIIENLKNNEVMRFNNVRVSLYKAKQLANNSDIKIKDIIAGNVRNNNLNIYDYDTISLLRYLRKKYGEQPSEYDNYFEYRGIEVKLRKDFEVNWI